MCNKCVCKEIRLNLNQCSGCGIALSGAETTPYIPWGILAARTSCRCAHFHREEQPFKN